MMPGLWDLLNAIIPEFGPVTIDARWLVVAGLIGAGTYGLLFRWK
jgi:hypothetical protein